MNRYAFNQKTSGYIDTDICLVMMDINKFKTTNDTFGHQTGDDVLKIFSDLLLRYFSKDEVYRYGGDEFLAVCPGVDMESIKRKMTLLNEEFSKTLIDGIDIGLSCSYGCECGHPANLEEFLDMLTSADNMLYRNKDIQRRRR